MESLNRTLFLWLNAPQHPSSLLLMIAIVVGSGLIWAIPILVGIGWLRGSQDVREAMIMAGAAGLVGLIISQLIGLAWPHPRPFMVALGHTYISHAADSSFPSDHLTLWWSVAFSLVQSKLRKAGFTLALLGLPIAWARIYLGVHFPFDMAGAAAVATISAWLTFRSRRWYLGYSYAFALQVHRRVFGKLIALGWVRD